MALNLLSASLFLPRSFSWESWNEESVRKEWEPPCEIDLTGFTKLSPHRFRFLDRASKIAILLGEKALAPLSLTAEERSRLAICFGVDQATFVSNQDHLNRIQQQLPLSPGIFTNTLPNIPGAMISITQQIYGEQYTFSSGAFSLLQALEQASYLTQRQPDLRVLCGTVVCSPTSWKLPYSDVGLLLVLQQAQNGMGNTLEFFFEKCEGSLLKEKIFPMVMENPDWLSYWAGEGTFALLLASLLRSNPGIYRIGMRQGNWIRGIKITLESSFFFETSFNL